MYNSRLPGIYTEKEQTNASTRRVPPLATGVMLIDAHRGLVNQRDVVTSVAEFTAKYGTFEQAANKAHHAAAVAFLQQGKALYVTRVKRADTAKRARISVDAGSVSPHNPAEDPANSSDGTTITVFALNAGDWGNSLSITLDNFDDQLKTYNMSVYTTQADARVLLETWTVSNTFSRDGSGRQLHAEQRINGKSEYIEVIVNTHASANDMPQHTVTDEALTTNGTLAQLSSEKKLVAGTLRVKEDAAGNFALIDNSKGVLSGPGGEGTINYNSGAYSIAYNSASTGKASYSYSSTFSLSGGLNGQTPTESDYIKALDIYRDKQDVAFEFLIEPVYSTDAYQTELVKLCSSRGDCIAMLNVPTFDDIRDVLLWRMRSGIDTSNAILFAPDVQVKRGGVLVNDSAAPYASSAYVENTDIRGPWAATAGEANSAIPCIGTSKRYTQDELLLLINNQINPVVPHYANGAVLFSQKTSLRSSGPLQNAHAKRTSIFILTNASNYLRSKIFKLNSAEVRDEITTQISQFLAIIQTNGGLVGFRVVCDGTNNTSATRSARVLKVDIYFTPVDVVETLKITLSHDGNSVSSTLSAAI